MVVWGLPDFNALSAADPAATEITETLLFRSVTTHQSVAAIARLPGEQRRDRPRALLARAVVSVIEPHRADHRETDAQPDSCGAALEVGDGQVVPDRLRGEAHQLLRVGAGWPLFTRAPGATTAPVAESTAFAW